MDSALTYQDHIEAVIAKALKLVGFIKRSTVDFKSAHTIISLYRSMVTFHTNRIFGSVLWSPFTQTASDKLEAIQHRLLRYCSLKTNHPLSFLDHDFTPLLFKYYDLIAAFKIIREIMVCQELTSLFSQREFTYCIRNPRPIHEQIHTKNYSFNTPIARLRRAWNQLPGNTRDIVLIGAFKSALRRGS